jgi:ferritin-like protein
VESRFFPRRTFAPLSARKSLAAADRDVRATDELRVLHDPPLERRDEAVFLLTAAAEIEHALMVQYLYAAYSVRVTGPQAGELQKVQNLLVQIAREEMGHLVTVQNLLHLVGGPLNLGRDRAPYADEIYPFRFTLEPVTRDSLAKYVTAESPEELPGTMTQEDRDLVGAIQHDAVAANGGNEIRHVGPLFERLAVLFGDPPDGLADEDFRTDTEALQATPADWGFAPLNQVNGSPLIIGSFPGTDVAALRSVAHTAIQEIADQGEGFDLPPAGPEAGESHFERFLDIYKRVSRLLDQGVEITWPVAVNPNTVPAPEVGWVPADELEATAEALVADGRITEPRARAWAQLFDLRYRMLLGQLAHFLLLDQETYTSAAGPRQGDRTARGLLLLGTFDEMRHLKKIAGKLVQMPKAPGSAVHAGPPFELPYTLNLPDGERSRWRTHLDASRAATRLLAAHPDATDPFLTALEVRDGEKQAMLQALADGDPIPPEKLPTGFAKAVSILDEAVHGFGVGARHGSFWAGVTRDQFVTTLVPPVDLTPVALDQNGEVVPDPAEAQLLERLGATDVRDRMPRFRPPVPPSRQAYLAQWVREGAPDDVPPDEVGVSVEPNPNDESPPPVEAPSFATDIVGLFRDLDRNSMINRFDLRRFEDVRDNATDILGRLERTGPGAMPCDGPWSAERIALFRRWIDGGRLP